MTKKRIKEITKELLRLYGAYLNYDEVKQLKYLNKKYKIDPLLSSHLIELNGAQKIDNLFNCNFLLSYLVATHNLKNQK